MITSLPAERLGITYPGLGRPGNALTDRLPSGVLKRTERLFVTPVGFFAWLTRPRTVVLRWAFTCKELHSSSGLQVFRLSLASSRFLAMEWGRPRCLLVNKLFLLNLALSFLQPAKVAHLVKTGNQDKLLSTLVSTFPGAAHQGNTALCLGKA